MCYTFGNTNLERREHMDLSTDLLIKIVIFLTAIVGLYKTANLKIAEPFIAQILAALSILIVPAAMLGFLWIANTTMNMMKMPKSTPSYAGSDAEIMYQISRELWNQQTRQEALKLAIERAFETKQWSVIVQASVDLNPTSQRDAVLMRAIKTLGGRTEVEPKSNDR
jgi:hypothetical protein